MTRRVGGRGRASAGFTLLEMMVALALVALVVAVALPRTRGTREAVLVDRAAVELSGALKTVRAAALRTSAEQALVLDLAARRYWSDGALKARTLPRGVSVAFEGGRGGAVAGDRALVSFHPDGSASGGRFRLKRGRSTASVEVDWLTGETRLKRKR